MKLSIAVVMLLVATWLGLWIASTGVLVYSSDVGLKLMRDCRYLIGVTVVERLAPLPQHCSLIRKVGN
jgi:hypothetical protein